MHQVLVNRLGGLSPPRKSVVGLTDHPNMTTDVYCGRKATIKQQQQPFSFVPSNIQIIYSFSTSERYSMVCAPVRASARGFSTVQVH